MSKTTITIQFTVNAAVIKEHNQWNLNVIINCNDIFTGQTSF